LGLRASCLSPFTIISYNNLSVVINIVFQRYNFCYTERESTAFVVLLGESVYGFWADSWLIWFAVRTRQFMGQNYNAISKFFRHAFSRSSCSHTLQAHCPVVSMNANILSIILYGSHARKDHDSSSDCDICVITRERPKREFTMSDLEDQIGPLKLANVTIVTYPEAVLNSMLVNGSLFLWHLKLEGDILYGRRYLSEKLLSLDHFKTHLEEINYHEELFYNLKMAWQRLSIVNELDLSLLFTIARNTCMVLTHKSGKPSFGRLSSYTSAKESFSSLPITIDQYLYLSKWKLLYERESSTFMPLPSRDAFQELLSIIEHLLQFAIRKTAEK
jgi:predicted nucleotidyltransferase